MKSVIILILSLTISFLNLSGQTATPPASGDGSESSPYQIATLNNLYWLSQNSIEWDKYFIQTADIDASTTSTWDDGDGGIADGFPPIGDGTTSFTGTYNGQDFTVSNLYINRPSTDNIALFGQITNATITSLGIESADITGHYNTGALVGFNNSGSNVSRCHSSGGINGVSGIGGLVGASFATVSECYSTANINASEHNNGGLIGYCKNATTSNSYSRGSVTAGGNNIGGFIGVNDGGCTVENCFSTGTITGGVQDVGGFVGDNGGGTITNSFWDITTSGMTDSWGGKGLPTDEMKDMVTFLDAEWDFVDEILNGTNEYWSFNSSVNDGYPFLNFQGNSRENRLILLTGDINSIFSNGALGHATIVYLGDNNPTAHGMCWNTTGNPTVSDNFSDEGTISSTGNFSSSITGLSANTTYYVRAYATDTDGTKYGDETVFTTYNAPSVGDGTVDNPYEISSLDNLSWLSQTSDAWGSYFIQTADIDATLTSTWNNGEGWSPIGNGETNFSGSYDGKGHTISNLYINRSEYYQGLFGLINNAEIKNLGLENVDITGDRRTGAITGSSYYSTIEYCYTTGNVSSSADKTGGIVGENYVYGKIINCYSRCSVSASSASGGIAGTNGNECAITNCYSTGIITGGSFMGGIAGYGYTVTTNCFWDTITSGIGTSIGGTGITTAEMTDLATYTDLAITGLDEAWDFPGYPNDDNGTASIWEIDAGINNGYPTLSWQYASTATIIMHAIDSINTTEAYITCDITNTGGTNITAAGVCWNTTGTPDVSDATSDEGAVSEVFQTSMTGLSAGGTYYVRPYVTNSEGTTYGNEIVYKTTPASGSGTEVDPYVISSLPELAWLMGNQNVWDQHFIQSANIEASETQNWFANKGFYPIGSPTNRFTGNFNGKGHAIINLNINRPDEEFLGLFGKTHMASFDSITLTNVNFVGSSTPSQYLGSVVAYAISSRITNCSSSGNISGNNGGGIAGFIDDSFVDGCYSSCTLSCNQSGGIVGRAEGSSVIKKSNSEGAVNGVSYTGGLVGFFRADSVLNCHSNATVTGEDNYTGGLIGYADEDIYVSSCHTTNNVQGADYVGGLFGFLNRYSYIEECYAEGTISGDNYLGGLFGSCGTTNTLINCYSHSNVTASSARAGGLIGQKGPDTNVYNCYSTGSVSALSNQGGLIGVSYAGTIENCFWDTQTSGLTYSNGGTGKTTAELKDTTTFTHLTTNGLTTAWDFFKNPGDDNAYQDIWHIDPGYNNGYPFFVHELIPEVQTVEATNIAVDSLTTGGIVVDEGSSPVIERGICWSTNSPPMIIDNKIQSGNGLGEFSENLTQLDTVTTYYIRAYAINAYDTAYGFIDTATTLKANQTITFNPIADVTYGSEAFKLSATTNSGLTIAYASTNPAVAEVSNDTVFIIGTGTTNIIASQLGNDTYYEAEDVTQPLNVLKQTLTVTADNKSKEYGAVNPELTMEYAGFVNNEDASVIDEEPVLNTTADILSDVGTYDITLSGGNDNNYAFSLVNGTLTVEKATLNASAVDTTRNYGQVEPEFRIEYTGFVNDEDQSILDEQPVASTTATINSDVGDYSITLSGGIDNNYAFSLADGMLTIEKATLNASAVDTTRNYGEPNPEFRIEYTGFANDDDYSVLDELPVASTSADINSDAGAYNITLSGGNDNNYLIYLFDGTLTIDKLDQEITFSLPDSVALESGFVELIAETTSGLEIIFESSDPSIAYIDGNGLRLSSVGTCTVSAIQEGGVNYNSASIDLPFTVYSGTNIFNDYARSKIKVYPNPIEDIIFIESSKNIERIEIYDMFGKKLKLFVPSANFINVSELKQGMYLLKIYDGKSNALFKVLKK